MRGLTRLKRWLSRRPQIGALLLWQPWKLSMPEISAGRRRQFSRGIDMGMKRLFWKIFMPHRGWSKTLFGLHYVPDQIDGILCAGVTVFGHSILYSDVW